MFHQYYINVPSQNRQWNFNVSEISTLKTLMIINVCIEINDVSSMLHQCSLKESSMERQCVRDKHIKNIKYHKCLYRNQHCFINITSMFRQRIINETSMFQRLAH